MKRPNWTTELANYILAVKDVPFSHDPALGMDCFRFTRGAILAQVPVDIGQFRYLSRHGSLMAMRDFCGEASLMLAVTRLMNEHGFAIVPAMYAQAGDAVVVPQGDSCPPAQWSSLAASSLHHRVAQGQAEFFGVLDLNGRDVVSVGERGLRRVPISIRCRAWRIA